MALWRTAADAGRVGWGAVGKAVRGRWKASPACDVDVELKWADCAGRLVTIGGTELVRITAMVGADRGDGWSGSGRWLVRMMSRVWADLADGWAGSGRWLVPIGPVVGSDRGDGWSG